ncbi:AAA family ATPase [Vibrio atlanticus]|uniref:AAA family ATPase n=1 Tax=Vibrio atlanticus TaxID=693153 RepID=UPI000EFC2265|nr:AAA family ATPase [Vibrio atlanticus]
MNIYYTTSVPKWIEPSIVLLPDHYGKNTSYLWDDYDYKTTFRAFIVSKNESFDLGFVKILFNGHKNSHQFIKENYDEVEASCFKITEMDKIEAVSLGTDIEYYKRISKYFDNADDASNFLSMILDASYLHEQLDEFNTWPGFSLSLLRNSSASANLTKGYAIATNNYIPLSEFSFSADTPCSQSIHFHFSQNEQLSGNINIVIGKNGFGKTKTLHNIANNFTGLNKDSVKWPYFNKLIVVSFSPFESFYTKKELKVALSSNSKNPRTKFINEYSYVGIKSDSKNDPINLDSLSRRSVVAYIDALIYDKENFWWVDDDQSSKESLILSTLKQAMDFKEIAVKHKDGHYLYSIDLVKLLRTHNKDQIKEIINADKGLIFLDEKNEEKNLSSGQKIYSLFTPSIISEIKEESLILIDEPELYLHPELEVGLMSMLKSILKETNSYSVIATHSSIIAREVKREHVNIFKKNNVILKPEIETFGNSLDEITGYVFDDYNTNKPYEELIDSLLSNYGSIDDAIKDLSSKVGDSALTYLYELKSKAISHD